jgi:hypothetical protein
VEAGQPLRYRPATEEPTGSVLVRPPEGEAKSVYVERWPLVYENTRDTGTYRLETPTGQVVHYVVRPDPRESDLTPATDAERQQVAQYVPVTYRDFRQPLEAETAETPPARDLWEGFLFAVTALLCAEVWMTRRIVRAR